MEEQRDEKAHVALFKDHSKPLAQRMRSLFHIRTLNTKEGRSALVAGLYDQKNSTLLRHEIAYVLGQMQALDVEEDLVKVMCNEADDVIIRHEAAEALGALGAFNSLEILRKYWQDANQPLEVRQTCELSVKRIERLLEEKHAKSASDSKRSQVNAGEEFGTVDPTDAFRVDELQTIRKDTSSEEITRAEKNGDVDLNELESILVDEIQPIENRYKAMFSLRNLNTDAAILSLAKGLRDTSSTLFRHEIAFVLGQMENKQAITALKNCLENEAEHEMVRHEAAEALGAISNKEATDLLKAYRNDSSQIVRESCEVALDSRAYWEAFETK